MRGSDSGLPDTPPSLPRIARELLQDIASRLFAHPCYKLETALLAHRAGRGRTYVGNRHQMPESLPFPTEGK
jgi:hypothetical protein